LNRLNKKKRGRSRKDKISEGIQEEIDIFRYLQNLSEKKQVALLHSALSGRLNEEGKKFMSSVFHLKKKQIYKNKFHSLINQAYPGVFAEDLGKDMNHHQLSLDNFRVLDYEEKGRKHKHKGRIPRVQSFNDLSANDRPYYTITESSQEPCRIIDRVRRKSCSCSYCGQANLGVNLKQAMQIVNPEFYISES